MKFTKYILFTLLIVIIGFSMYIATLNDMYNLKHTKTVKAPIEVVFEEINDFKNWQNWGPWYEIDTTIIASFEGKTTGEGASYSWTGKEGDGSMKTISVVPNRELIQQIDFGTGSTPEVYWNLEEEAEGTSITWGMRGKSTFTEKIYWLFKGGIEKNMIPTYERGLVLLDEHLVKEMDKQIVEYPGVVEYGGGFYMYKTTSSKIDEVRLKMVDMFTDINKYMETNAIQSSGKPFIISHQKDVTNGTTIFSACVPIRERVITQGDVLSGLLKTQKTFKTILKGDYKHLKTVWENAYIELQNQGLTPLNNGEPFEIYTVNQHDTRNPSKWVTEIYIPIK
ncbi:SRPBCC family protein [Lutibacter sp.]|uniref:SRPBCC family protein n=1 Tax=Lutibacter sp. TaxID=1925666 RepID=UPI002734408E|nr:SRPBCC family protein [Lutibacter sp.]MDP3312890.1 SRPBCC family protein [Lutibacter sp.]